VKDRHIVVTGGNGALGKGVALVLQATGAIVHVADRPDVQLDSEASASAFYGALPPIWASVHLVGGFAMKPLAETSAADFEAQWRINALTCFLACREAVASMRKGGAGGRIVNVAARPVIAPVGGMAAYVASKASVASLTQTLAVELLPENILVNAVLPSTIDTPANRAAMPGADHGAWPKPAQLAQAIAFLISPENALTTGTLVPVFGHA